MMFVRQCIGIVILLVVGLVYILGEPLMWLTVSLVSAIAPRHRESMLRFWVHVLKGATVILLRVAGARFDVGLRVPCEPGILLISNHQSIVDIPVAYMCVPDGYPTMVAHHRYWKGIPLISHMMRLYGHIPVYPGRTGREELNRLTRLVRAAEHPVIIYPEGHRTRDGEIRPWKRAGLEAFLSARPWKVYVLVVDGLWKSGRIPDFVRTISQVRCRAEAVGPFEYDGREREDHSEFIDRLETAMCDKLAEMRRTHTSAVREATPAESAVSR
ncbi:MAG TPA: lysophospholipid acyltransferase family protein [Candidatus Krumholzibacteria bacterium]|nr:lysophospholipid acyltransferase family protein [Candidatus Krumholzibacteria bacterium]